MLPHVLNEMQKLTPFFAQLEILVADNGSDDSSAALARRLGARVVECPERGYGAALQAGIAQATHEFVVFADADGTYDWSEAPKLMNKMLASGADLVVGNRLRGSIERGAMPFLNRHLGTPLLSLLITALYGWKRGVLVGDCNGGMRVLRKKTFAAWGTRHSGMEFASEMIVRALKSDARYAEVPISYRCAPPGRFSHLKRWSDGWRHLKAILGLLFT